MSASIPPPQGLPPPKREIRVLRQIPLFLFAGAAACVIGVVYYGLTHMGGVGWFASEPQVAATTDSDASEVLRNAPTENKLSPRKQIVPAAVNMNLHLPNSTLPTSQEPAAPVDDDMTETAIAARKAAWDAYYKALADAQQHRLTARYAAMASDTVPEATASNAPGTLPGIGGGGMGSGEPRQPKDFFGRNASSPDTDYSPYTLTNPASQYELKAGDITNGILETEINSDSPGMIRARVTKSLFDYATGMNILIPQGSRLVGVYDTNISYGQTRVVTAWQRIIYPPPCSQSLDLGAMAGSDQSGSGGFEDITNNHLGKVFLNAMLVSVFGAAVQLSQPPGSALQQYNPVQSAAGAVGTQMAELGQEFARRGLNIPPTEQVRQGYPFTVLLTKDIAFERPWVDGQCAEMDVATR